MREKLIHCIAGITCSLIASQPCQANKSASLAAKQREDRNKSLPSAAQDKEDSMHSKVYKEPACFFENEEA